MTWAKKETFFFQWTIDTYGGRIEGWAGGTAVCFIGINTICCCGCNCGLCTVVSFTGTICVPDVVITNGWIFWLCSVTAVTAAAGDCPNTVKSSCLASFFAGKSTPVPTVEDTTTSDCPLFGGNESPPSLFSIQTKLKKKKILKLNSKFSKFTYPPLQTSQQFLKYPSNYTQKNLKNSKFIT